MGDGISVFQKQYPPEQRSVFFVGKYLCRSNNHKVILLGSGPRGRRFFLARTISADLLSLWQDNPRGGNELKFIVFIW